MLAGGISGQSETFGEGSMSVHTAIIQDQFVTIKISFAHFVIPPLHAKKKPFAVP